MRSRDAHYQCLERFLVRVPLLPVRTFLSLPGLLLEELPTTVPDSAGLGAAIQLAAPDLYRDLTVAPISGKKAGKASQALLRYFIRVSTRATPFGLFAGVGLGHWGAGEMRISAEPWKIHARPDLEWLYQFIFALEGRPEIVRKLRVQAHQALVFRNDRIFLTNRAPRPVKSTVVASIRAGRLVNRALELAARPILFQDLVEALRSELAAVPEERVVRSLSTLCRETFLLSELRAPLIGLDPAEAVARSLSLIEEARGEFEPFRALLEECVALDGLGLVPELGSAFQRARNMARDLVPEPSPQLLRVEMGVPLAEAELPASVATAAVSAAELLLRLSPAPLGPAGVTKYRDAFLERYGRDREVPLLELLDPETGLGPITEEEAASTTAIANRSKALMQLAAGALARKQRVLDLTEEDLNRLEMAPLDRTRLASSLDLTFFLCAPAFGDLREGRFLLVPTPAVGAKAAGNTLGRFTGLLGASAQTALDDVLQAERANAPECLWVELSSVPADLRAANVCVRQVPCDALAHEGVFGSPSEHEALALADIMVVLTQDGFQLKRSRDGRPFRIRSTHVLNWAHGTEVGRFLFQLAQDGKVPLTGFDWGWAEAMPYLPRVQHGNNVLAGARWKIGVQTLGDGPKPSSWPEFQERFQAWRREWDVPSPVYLAEGDNRLLLDLDDDKQLREVQNALRRLEPEAQVTLQEALPGPQDAWLTGPAGNYLCEITASLVLKPLAREVDSANPILWARTPSGKSASTSNAPISTPVVASQARRVPPVTRAQRLRPPGSDWLYLKYYGPRSSENDVLTGPFWEFLQREEIRQNVLEWFFVRYTDPEPHLRLRFRGNPEALFELVLPSVTRWASGLVERGHGRGFAFDTYDREVERYGGVEAMPLFESVFGIDSRYTIEVLRLTKATKDPGDFMTLGVASAFGLARGLGQEISNLEAWCARLSGSWHEAAEAFRTCAPSLAEFLSLLENPHHSGGGVRLKAAEMEAVSVMLRRSAELAPLSNRLTVLESEGRLGRDWADILASAMHLHCIRLLGGSSAMEKLAMGILFRAVNGFLRSGAKAREV